MAYSVHIMRYDRAGNRVPIEVCEWIEAASALNGVRLVGGEVTASNPVSGERIVVFGDGVNAELHDEQRNIWLPVFRWSARGSVSFNPPPDFDDATSRIRIIAGALAHSLGAELIGDDGEAYV